LTPDTVGLSEEPARNGLPEERITDRAQGVALAHDYLLVMRGAERTFREMSRCWPDAPINTLLYDETGTEGRFANRRIRTSYLNRLGLRQGRFRNLLPFFPRAARSLQSSQPVLVSSTSAFAHGVRSRGPHVCYCHSPFRYAWFEHALALDSVRPPVRPVLRRILSEYRRWDLESVRGVTAFVANSRLTQERIATYWDRDSSIVHPPVELSRFHVGEPEDFFLVVAELVSHKRIEVALNACNRVGVKVKVVGEGPEAKRLKATYPAGVSFLGRVSDEKLADLYARCVALIVPNVEEFGIAAVEAQAAGRPVLAPETGGAQETVIDGETGVLIPGAVDHFAEAIRHTPWSGFSPQACVKSANRFAPSVFRRRLVSEVRRLVDGGAPDAAPVAGFEGSAVTAGQNGNGASAVRGTRVPQP
jgi:glycosyltransferase involved in cell wall biosynthesis